MTCIDTVCGTGGFTGPKPGDPDNNSTLSAVSAFGGIDVSWTYPATNPAAVAHVLLYRNSSNNFAGAIQLAVVSGSFFYDKMTTGTTYYYWIQIVSVNGTVGDTIGPASATARPLVGDLLTTLNGQIDYGVLATALRADIDSVSIFGGRLSTEISSRSQGEAYLAAALAAAQSTGDQTLALVHSQNSTQTSRSDALATQMNLVAAAVGQNTSAIISEQTARSSSVGALTTQLNSVAATSAQNTAAIVTEQSARTSAVGSLTTQLNSVAATSTGNVASIAAEQSARATADTALADSIVTTRSTLEGNTAAVQTALQTNINTVDGKVSSIGALYTAKVNVNGLVGGFGVYNDGSSVEAGFDVDTFWVGRTNSDKRKPFIISGGVTYIDSATIRDADIGTLKIAGEAVTVPRYAATASYTASASITLTESAEVFVLSTVHVPNSLYWQRLKLNGVDIRTEMCIGGSIPCLINKGTLGAGTHTLTVSNDDTSATSAAVYILATKR
jgi:hypothetical protein